MTEPEVKSLLFREFRVWMRGQTLGVGPGGEPEYYEQDVQKFVDMVHNHIVAKQRGVTD